MYIIVSICTGDLFLGIYMKYLFMTLVFWSGLSLAEIDARLNNLEVNNDPLEGEIACYSMLCKNTTKPDSVARAGDFPERNRNQTLSFLGNMAFIAGEVGLAENLQEREEELTVLP